jgi:hypothetical protein
MRSTSTSVARASLSAFGLACVLAAPSCSSSDDAKREWTTVSSGSLIGNGVTHVNVDAQGNFVALDSSRGVVGSGADPTALWQPVTALAGARRIGDGTGAFAPIVDRGTRVFQSTPEGWVDRGPSAQETGPAAYAAVMAADDGGHLIVQRAGGSIARLADGGGVEVLYTPTPSEILANFLFSPKGAVFVLDPSTKASEIYRLVGGRKVPVLQGLGCPDGAAATCTRGVVPLGFDRSGALYVATLAKRSSEQYFSTRVWDIHKYAGDTWSALPAPPSVVLDGHFSCAVTGNGTLYCQRKSPEPVEASDPDQTSTLVRLEPGGSEWVDLGDLPGVENDFPVFTITARDDGRVALTCCALGNGNDGLWVSK